MKLLSDGGTNYKQAKSNAKGVGYLSSILYLAPHKNSGAGNVCAAASAGCAAACLYTAGRGKMSTVKASRIRKTKMFFDDRAGFIAQLKEDVKSFIKKCNKLGKLPAVRLNGTSDLPWESWGIIEEFPEVQFYDYTKILKRMLIFCKGGMPANYHLTFSRSETNEAKCLEVLRAGGNVTAVFASGRDKYQRFRVIDGDSHDLRFLDPSPRWVGLLPKGDAKRDDSGFVVR